MAHSLMQKRREALRRRLSNLSVQFCNDPNLLANPVLAKNTFYADLLASLDWDGADLAVSRTVKAKQLVRYAVRSAAWLGSLAVNTVITRWCWNSPLHTEFAVSARGEARPLPAKDEGGRPLILIDTFFHMRRIAEKGSFTEVYMPRMADALSQAGVDYAYLPRVCEGENPLVYYRALKVLERQRVPVVLDTQLFSISDFAAITWNIIKTPFVLRRVFNALDTDTPDTAQESDRAFAYAESGASHAQSSSADADEAGCSEHAAPHCSTAAPNSRSTEADNLSQSDRQSLGRVATDSVLYDDSVSRLSDYFQGDMQADVQADTGCKKAERTASSTVVSSHAHSTGESATAGAGKSDEDLRCGGQCAAQTFSDTGETGNAGSPATTHSGAESGSGHSFAMHSGSTVEAGPEEHKDTAQSEQSLSVSNSFIDSRISRALWMSLHDVTVRYFARWRTGRRLGALSAGLAGKKRSSLTIVSWFENQQTEKLLFRGVRDSGFPCRIIGAQLLVVPPEQMNMQPDMAEEPLGVLPDSILAVGPHALAEDATGRAVAGPALRYGHLFTDDCKQYGTGADVLVLLSISEAENRSLLSRLCEIPLALPDGAALLVKFHPDTDPQDYAALLPRGAQPVSGTMPQALQRARLVIGTGSGSLAEAACHGIPVIVSSMGGSGALNYMPAPGEGEIWFAAHCAEDIKRHATRLLSLTEPERTAMCRSGMAMRDAVFHNPTVACILHALGVPQCLADAAEQTEPLCQGSDAASMKAAGENATNRIAVNGRGCAPGTTHQPQAWTYAERDFLLQSSATAEFRQPSGAVSAVRSVEPEYMADPAVYKSSGSGIQNSPDHVVQYSKSVADVSEYSESEELSNDQLMNSAAKETQALGVSDSGSCYITSESALAEVEYSLYRAALACLSPDNAYAQALATLPVPAYPSESRRLTPSRHKKAACAIRRMVRYFFSTTVYGFLTGGLAASATTTPSPAAIADPHKTVAEYEEAFTALLNRLGRTRMPEADVAETTASPFGIVPHAQTDSMRHRAASDAACADDANEATRFEKCAEADDALRCAGHSVSFASARMGFYALLCAAGIGKGDEVILPAFTCAVMADAILRTGAVPVYTDVDPVTLGTSPEAVRRAVTPRTKVVVAQHSFGIPCRVDELAAFTGQQGLLLIEDCALTLGSRLKDRITGSFGDAAIFSTDHSKPLNTLIGGVVYTRNKDLYDAVAAIAQTAPELDSDHQLRLWQQLLFESTLHRPESYGRYPISSLLRRISDRLYHKGPVFLTADAPDACAAEKIFHSSGCAKTGTSASSDSDSVRQPDSNVAAEQPQQPEQTACLRDGGISSSETEQAQQRTPDSALPAAKHPYPYPARMPAFLARGGAAALVSFDAAAQNRRVMLQRYLDVIADTSLAPYVPAAYYDTSRHIIPHRFVMPVPDAQAMLSRMERKIDTAWIWFREPVVCTAGGLHSAGYTRGACPVSEAMSVHLVNWPTDVPPEHADELLRFFRSVIKDVAK
ncbi:DegT/DnrJ/EryC1/StrS family aminotransferase [Oleidesulfovibrio sp.]|uniref:DegT/DnrJ/EryC1/StrS family aminotransferase n=1 Tax=Oleidesulfovibrio sp. TaxID=2909707 RepID=UPI003A87B867